MSAAMFMMAGAAALTSVQYLGDGLGLEVQEQQQNVRHAVSWLGTSVMCIFGGLIWGR